MANWHKYVRQGTLGVAKGLTQLATLFITKLWVKEFGSSRSVLNGDIILRVVCEAGLIAAARTICESATKRIVPIPVAARSKAWICSLSLAGISGSISAGGMGVWLFWMLSVVRYRSLRRAYHSSRGILPSVVCLASVIAKPRKGRPWPRIGSKPHKNPQNKIIRSHKDYNFEGTGNQDGLFCESKFTDPT